MTNWAWGMTKNLRDRLVELDAEWLVEAICVAVASNPLLASQRMTFWTLEHESPKARKLALRATDGGVGDQPEVLLYLSYHAEQFATPWEPLRVWVAGTGPDPDDHRTMMLPEDY